MYHESQAKTITGVIVQKSNLLLPNKRHKKIWETANEHMQSQDRNQKQRMKNKLDGMLREAQQITQVSVPTVS